MSECISMDLKNIGTTDFSLRLLFQDPMAGPPDEPNGTFIRLFTDLPQYSLDHFQEKLRGDLMFFLSHFFPQQPRSINQDGGSVF